MVADEEQADSVMLNLVMAVSLLEARQFRLVAPRVSVIPNFGEHLLDVMPPISEKAHNAPHDRNLARRWVVRDDPVGGGRNLLRIDAPTADFEGFRRFREV